MFIISSLTYFSIPVAFRSFRLRFAATSYPRIHRFFGRVVRTLPIYSTVAFMQLLVYSPDAFHLLRRPVINCGVRIGTFKTIAV